MPVLRPLFVVLFSMGLVAGCGMGSSPAPKPTPGPGSGTVLLSEPFDRTDRLVTNEYAFWNPAAADAVFSPTWEMTSGSLFVRSGSGWTGVPDDRGPDATSSAATDSAVFRLTTRRSDLADVAVDFDLRLNGLTQTTTTPSVAWDGVHVFLRYQDEESLYYASVDRRDGTTTIKKKVRGGPSNGGTYFDLATGHHPVSWNTWEHVRATVGNTSDGGVAIQLFVGGVLVANAVDRGVGGPPITHAGKVGIRGDNAEFDVDEFLVTVL